MNNKVKLDSWATIGIYQRTEVVNLGVLFLDLVLNGLRSLSTSEKDDYARKLIVIFRDGKLRDESLATCALLVGTKNMF